MTDYPERLAAMQPFWGSWYLDAPLGEGSYGKVYRIRREEFGQITFSALKWIALPQNRSELRAFESEGMDEASLREYFHGVVRSLQTEVTLLSRLRGTSHIVSLEDYSFTERVDEVGWDVLVRMELLTPLPDRLREGMTVGDVLKMGLHMCNALSLCAKHGIVHRDIKPDNIFYSPNGDYKLGDFGVARQMERTQTNMSRKGTPFYMAPEVFLGRPGDATVDQYSLGLVMHRLLNAQRLPFAPMTGRILTHPEREAAFEARMKGTPMAPPLQGGPQLKQAVVRACSYKPRQRFASPDAMHAALLACTKERGLDEPLILSASGQGRSERSSLNPGGLTGRIAKAARSRTRRLMLGLSAALAGLVLLGALMLFGNFPGTGPSPTAAPTTLALAEPSAAPQAEQPVAAPSGQQAAASPTTLPTAVPTAAPTAVPTPVPAAMPTTVPTVVLTAAPTAIPTPVPTAAPTAVPTPVPAAVQTTVPTVVLTAAPTAVPTPLPAAVPTTVSTAVPTPALTPAPRALLFPADINNLPNGGMIVSDGQRFYAQHTGPKETYHLYQVTADFRVGPAAMNQQRTDTKYCLFDSRLYFYSKSDKKVGLYAFDMRNGTASGEAIRIGPQNAMPYAVDRYGVYYAVTGSKGIWRTNHSGGDKVKLSSHEVSGANNLVRMLTHDSVLYYVNAADALLYAVPTDGSSSPWRVSSEKVHYFILAEYRGEPIFVFVTYGKNREQLTQSTLRAMTLQGDLIDSLYGIWDVRTRYVNCLDGWLYYTDSADGSSLKRLRLDNTGQRERVLNRQVGYVHAFEGWIAVLPLDGSHDRYFIDTGDLSVHRLPPL